MFSGENSLRKTINMIYNNVLMMIGAAGEQRNSERFFPLKAVKQGNKALPAKPLFLATPAFGFGRRSKG